MGFRANGTHGANAAWLTEAQKSALTLTLSPGEGIYLWWHFPRVGTRMTADAFPPWATYIPPLQGFGKNVLPETHLQFAGINHSIPVHDATE
jgi:hypothetical protein